MAPTSSPTAHLSNTAEQEPELLRELFDLKKDRVAFRTLLVGLLCIVVALGLALTGLNGSVWSEYLKDLGFHLAAAGFVLLVIEPKLEGASNAYMQASIKEA